MSFTRFAVYYLPPDGPLATFGAKWLGWDVATGTAADRYHVPGLDDVTMTPRKYGFHGTLKPPFRLADGQTLDGLAAAIESLAASAHPAQCDGLELRRLGRFLALTPEGDMRDIGRIAAACVTDLDKFRAPADDAELTRRRAAGLSPRQETLLTLWGYPYVMEEFRFHLTLTGKLGENDVGHWANTAAGLLPRLPQPFHLDTIALVGEREDGGFQLIQRYALTG
ncbi:MAG: DUF1045 domain-containing protein [Pseudomonadota bacterium]